MAGAALSTAACDQFKKGYQDAVRDSTASEIDKLPRASIIGELRNDFPQEYAQLKAQAAQTTATQGPAAVEQVGADFMKRFYASHLTQLEQAPPAALARVTASNIQLLTAAQGVSDATCAGLWANGSLPPASQFTSALKTAVEDAGQAQVAAIKAGADQPANRTVDPISHDEHMRLVQAAAKFGATQQQIEAGPSQTNAVRCATGLAVYRGFQTLPPDFAARLQARFLHIAMSGA